MEHETAKILLVDDDADIRKILEEGLGKAGYQCVSFASGEDALENLDGAGIDLALVDLHLPGIDGIELVRRLRASAGADQFLPVILVTGDDEVEERLRGFRAGCDDFFGKPVSLFELSARVGSLLAHRAQHAELARANARLREQQEKKKVLAALVVHDLRNPLSALQGNIELLAEEVAGQTDFVDEILGDCRVLTVKSLELVAGLLDVEEFEAGLLQTRVVEAKVSEVVARAAKYHGATVAARKLTLEFDVDPELTATLDVELTARLVENLLDNAVRYAPRKGKVVVSAERDRGDLVIRVGNNGPPVPRSERDKIFGRYYRLEARRSGARSNRGLGLYFCLLVAQAHGGSIDLEELEDLPASFIVRIPQ